MNKITTHIRPDGRIAISPQIIKKMVGKKLTIIYAEKKENEKIKTEDHSDFWDLLKNGPKFKGPEGKITRESIHDRGEDDIRYR